MTISEQTIVGDIVSSNYKTAAVFSKLKIDFCCNGNRSLAQASKDSDANLDELINSLTATLNNTNFKDTNYQAWSLDFLADYIYNNHHLYIEEKIPIIKQYLDKVCSVHGNIHPELFDIQSLFYEGADDLTQHLKKEELILFPFIKKMVTAEKENFPLTPAHFGTVENPIAMMHEEHNNEGERYRKISKLSNNYTPPHDACTTYKVLFSMLDDFEKDLHLHIHLENNILFKKALELEKKLKNN